MSTIAPSTTRHHIASRRTRTCTRARLAGLGAVCLAFLLSWPGAAFADDCSWTGGGADNKWSTDANWNCGGIVRRPQDLDSLLFPDGMPRPANENDIPNLAVNFIAIQGVGAGGERWEISNAPDVTITLLANFEVSSPADSDGEGPSFQVPIRPFFANTEIIIRNNGTASFVMGDISLDAVNGPGASVRFAGFGVGGITVAGHISGAGGSPGVRPAITVDNVLTLNDNSYTGGTLINSGTIVAAHAHAVGASGAQDVVDIRLGGELVLSDGIALEATISLTGEISVPAGATATIDGPLLLPVVPGELFNGDLDVHGALSITQPITGNLGASLTQSGGGIVTLSSTANVFDFFDVHSGTLRVGAPQALPARVVLKLSLGQEIATLDLNGFDATIGVLSGGEGGRVLLGSRTLTVDTSVGERYSGSIAGTGNFVKSGPAPLEFAGATPNTYTGTTTVQAGDLVLSKTAVNGTIVGPLIVNGGRVISFVGEHIADQSAVIVNAPGRMMFGSALANETIGSLAGSGNIILDGGSLRIGVNNASTIYGGAISGSGEVTKVGAGALTLTGGNTHRRTVVANGTLLVNGTVTSEIFPDGGTIGGAGTIDAITNGSNSTVSPGPRPGPGTGILRARSAILTGIDFVAEINGPQAGADYDQLAVTDLLQIFSTSTLSVTLRFDPPRGAQFTIMSLAPGKAVIGNFKDLPEGTVFSAGLRRFGISYQGGDGNDVVLTVANDPPPIPPVTSTYFLSEGATGSFFDEDVLIANPHAEAAPVTLTFAKENGEQVAVTRSVPAQSRVTVHVDQIPGLEQTAASVLVTSESGRPLVVERSMFWDETYYAGHTGSAVDTPASDWFFAEGSQGFFDTFVLIINPNATPVDVTFTFFREHEPPVVTTRTVGARTRLTLHAGEEKELVDRSFGIAVHATQPIMAERAMYFGRTAAGQLRGGSESAGVTAAATKWFLAEGATGTFFDTFVLLSNPQNTPAQVTLEYLLDTGDTVSVRKTIAANGRLTTNIEMEEDVRLQNAAVSTVVTSDVPIIAERSMYWPGPAASSWAESHNSFGVAEARTTWGLAEGRRGGPLNYHTYILLANPQSTDAEVTVSFLREAGAPVTKTYIVPRTSRFNIDTNEIEGLEEASFGTVIRVTNGVPIIVERSLYWDSNDILCSGGTNATGIPLPDTP